MEQEIYICVLLTEDIKIELELLYYSFNHLGTSEQVDESAHTVVVKLLTLTRRHLQDRKAGSLKSLVSEQRRELFYVKEPQS